jgi:hypothetical protein
MPSRCNIAGHLVHRMQWGETARPRGSDHSKKQQYDLLRPFSYCLPVCTSPAVFYWTPPTGCCVLLEASCVLLEASYRMLCFIGSLLQAAVCYWGLLQVAVFYWRPPTGGCVLLEASYRLLCFVQAQDVARSRDSGGLDAQAYPTVEVLRVGAGTHAPGGRLPQHDVLPSPSDPSPGTTREGTSMNACYLSPAICVCVCTCTWQPCFPGPPHPNQFPNMGPCNATARGKVGATRPSNPCDLEARKFHQSGKRWRSAAPHLPAQRSRPCDERSTILRMWF